MTYVFLILEVIAFICYLLAIMRYLLVQSLTIFFIFRKMEIILFGGYEGDAGSGRLQISD